MPTMEQRLAALEAEKSDPEKRPPAGNRISRFLRWFGSLETWKKIAFAVLVFAAIALLALVAGITTDWLVGKAKHAIAVLAYGLVGAFVGFVIAWMVNHVKAIRERAVPAADDSMWGIMQWRAGRAKKPDAAWTVQDAQTTLAASVRFGLSYLGIVILAGVAMMLAA